MAKYEAVLKGDLAMIIGEVERAIDASMTSSHEESVSRSVGGARIIIRAYERYSYLGQNRVGLTITYVESGGEIYVCAVATGGSQAVLFKINTLGEQSFIEVVEKVLEKYRIRGV